MYVSLYVSLQVTVTYQSQLINFTGVKARREDHFRGPVSDFEPLWASVPLKEPCPVSKAERVSLSLLVTHASGCGVNSEDKKRAATANIHLCEAMWYCSLQWICVKFVVPFTRTHHHHHWLFDIRSLGLSSLQKESYNRTHYRYYFRRGIDGLNCISPNKRKNSERKLK